MIQCRSRTRCTDSTAAGEIEYPVKTLRLGRAATIFDTLEIQRADFSTVSAPKRSGIIFDGPPPRSSDGRSDIGSVGDRRG